MSKKRTSLYLREEQIDAAQEIAREATGEDESDLSQSEVFRTLFDTGIEHSELSDFVSEERQILMERERFIDETAKVQKLRMGFPGRVRYHIKNQFESGLRPEDLDAFGENLKRDAVILWPNDSDRVEKEKEYVDRWIDTARAAIQASEYSPMDPSQLFGSYSAIADAVEDGSVRDELPEILETFRDRMEIDKHANTSEPPQPRDPKIVVETIAKDRGLSEDAITEAIEEIADAPIHRVESEDVPAIDPDDEIETETDADRADELRE